MLQPAVRFGSTSRRRGYGNPSLGLPEINENDSASARELAYNKAAAAQNLAMRETGDSGKSEESRRALARALGYAESGVTPPLAQLLARFQSLTPQVQAGIYQAGGAQFLDPKTGEKLLADVTASHQKAQDETTSDIVRGITSGKIQYDIGEDGKPSWYVMQEQDIDPTNPILGKKQVRQPASQIVRSYIQRAVEQGHIPDPVSGKFPESAPALTTKQDIQRRMTSEDFQKVLDARASGQIAGDAMMPSQAQLAANLAATKKPGVVDTGEMFGPRMPITRPNLGYIPSGQAQQDFDINRNAAAETAANLGAAIPNLGLRMANYGLEKAGQVNRFLFGDKAWGGAQLPLIQPEAPLQSTEVPNASYEQWFQERRARKGF